jgi:tetratricopeptide (TPR) repeat protein
VSSADRSAPQGTWAAVVPGAQPIELLVPPEPPASEPSAPETARAVEAGPVDTEDVSGGIGEAFDSSPPDVEIFEIDLSGDLDELSGPGQPAAARLDATLPVLTDSERAAEAASPDGVPDLEQFFQGLREQTGRHAEGFSASVVYDQASEHYNRGEIEPAVECLTAAARDPVYRFRAASMLARIARDQQRLTEALEWLERAVDAPAPTVEAARGLLYELGDTLEAAGEDARALAVFLELQSTEPEYRDVGARVARLSPGQQGRAGPWRGSA